MQRVHLGSSTKILCVLCLLTFFKGRVPSLLPAEHPAQQTDCTVWSPSGAAALWLILPFPAEREGRTGQGRAGSVPKHRGNAQPRGMWVCMQ